MRLWLDFASSHVFEPMCKQAKLTKIHKNAKQVRKPHEVLIKGLFVAYLGLIVVLGLGQMFVFVAILCIFSTFWHHSYQKRKQNAVTSAIGLCVAYSRLICGLELCRICS